VLASAGREGNRQSLYNGSGWRRIWRRRRRLAAVAALLHGLTAGGCSYQLSSLLSTTDADADAETTAAFSRPGDQAGRTADASTPAEVDLAYARAVAAEALARGGKDASVPWVNPHTGAGGNITPLAAAHNEGGFTCRDFLASYIGAGAQAWLQGEACRTDHGRWEVKSLTPLKRG
jgi:surface antigen